MTREEAIKRIKAWNLDEDDMEVLSAAIPELTAETDDENERIRKDIIALIKFGLTDGSAVSPGSHTTKEEAIAYLENLGEQKYLYYDQGFAEGMRQSKLIANSEIIVSPLKMTNKVSVSEELYEHIRETCACIDDAMSSKTLVDITEYLEMADKSAQAAFDMLEKQKEQKPAECLKAERDGWYVCIKDYYRGGKKQSSVGDLIQAKGGMFVMGEEDISEWFRKAYYEEVRNAFEPNANMNIPEQPAEWSEEDNEVLQQVIADIEDLIAAETSPGFLAKYNKHLDWLKLLPERFYLTPKQEWSEVEFEFRGEKVKVKRPFFRDDKGHEYSTAEQDEDVAWYAFRAWCEKKGVSLYDLYPRQDEDVAWYAFRAWCEKKGVSLYDLYPREEWSEEDEKILNELLDHCNTENATWYNWLKSLRPQPKDKTYKEKDEAFKLGKHQLAIEFMNYLDSNRPEGKMSLSNGECEDIDKAFKENDWAKIMRYVEKYIPSWKPSEEQMNALKEVRAIFHHHLWDEINPILYDYEELMRDLQKLL